MSERTKVVGYLRVSTECQADKGVSLAAQRAKVEAYAALYDLELVDIIEDAGASAKTLKRPGLQRALAMLEAGEADGLLVAKLDRLTRSVRDLGSLLEQQFTGQFSLFSVAEQVDPRTAAGRLVLNILAIISQWEREVIGERTAEALQHMMAAEGARLGGEALGWTRTEDLDEHGRRRWVEAKGEAETVQRILELHREGDSFSGIARKLEAEGHRTKRGGKWSHKQVGRAIRRAQRGAA